MRLVSRPQLVSPVLRTASSKIGPTGAAASCSPAALPGPRRPASAPRGALTPGPLWKVPAGLVPFLGWFNREKDKPEPMLEVPQNGQHA